MVGNDENVLVEFDYQNIVIVDPNKVVDSEGNIKDRALKQENLVMYANLECDLLPRTRLAVGKNGVGDAQTIQIASINFLSPNGEKFLKSSYYDEFTGEKNQKGDLKYNQSRETLTPISKEGASENYYWSQTTDNNYDTGLLGIKNISIDVKTNGFASVKMQLEDVRGRALFEKGEQSPYAAFFNLPYPIFYLTVKGYVGQAIKYQLALQSFKASYNSNTGNYTILLEFISYKFNVLTNVSIAHLIATPHMYNVQYNVSQNSAQPNSQTEGNSTTQTQQIITSRGYNKIREVYSEYKSKKLISQDLPELTLNQLTIKLSQLEKFLVDALDKIDTSPITNADTYRGTLGQYRNDVFYGDSWYLKYIDKENYFIANDGTKVYTFKRDIFDNNQTGIAVSELKTLITKYNDLLTKNPTFGTKTNTTGFYRIPQNIVTDSSIDVDINYSTFQKNLVQSDINYQKTFEQRNGRQPISKDELDVFINNNNTTYFNATSSSSNQNIAYTWFYFEGLNSFAQKTDNIEKKLQSKIEEINNKITSVIENQVQAKENGIGFEPTIRNVVAIIMANAEAFLRLMNDTHSKAWSVRNEPIRINSILGNQNNVTNPDDVSGNPIYPWPQYFIQKSSVGDEIYELAYPGDSSVVDKTKGYLKEIWPEVDFVEEYLKGLNQTNNPLIDPGPLQQNTNIINRISFNALDFVTKNDIFGNKEEVKFFYEIWERMFISMFYQKFGKDLLAYKLFTETIAESEAINLQNALGSDNPYLISKLKNYGLQAALYKDFMRSISNQGTGTSWQLFIHDQFVTQYIRDEVNDSFKIFKNQLNFSVEPTPKSIEKFSNILQTTTTNEFDITDTFPFSVNNWYKNNLADSITSNQNQIYNTTKVLKYNPSFKMISNFDNTTTNRDVRPITQFNFYNYNLPEPVNGFVGLKSFYDTRTIPDFLPTEGYVRYKNYEGNCSNIQSTSIFNTPYFSNSIVDGVDKWLNNDPYPYVSSAYLFLNSLPLATLREKYKTYKGTTVGNTPSSNSQSSQISTEDLDYIFATLKKFGAIHKVPYAWLLKCGSIWHRYKKYTEDGVDILNNVWDNLNYTELYDPITSSDTKQYFVTIDSTTYPIVLQQTTNVLGTDVSQINIGFYPKLINYFNIFYKGTNLFTQYTDQELNAQLNTGYTLSVVDSSVIDKQAGYNPSNPNQTLKITPWLVTIKDDTNLKTYVVPSFASNVNQIQKEIFNDSGQQIISPLNNSSVYNGSVRGLWAAPNFGYFDNNNIDKPNPEKYPKVIFTGQSQQEAISFDSQSKYTNIEDLFGTFNKQILDILEVEFLNFSKSLYDYTFETGNQDNIIANTQSGNLQTDSNTQYKNFQYLMREMMGIGKVEFTNSGDYVKNVSEKQLQNVVNLVKGFLEYDVTFKYGNPSNYDRLLFDSFSNVNFVEGKISPQPYLNGSLPPQSTLFDSQTSNPSAWNALKIFVGESSTPNMVYSDAGSTITDFFIDNNVEFTATNVQLLAPLIKIYATQKSNNPSYNSSSLRDSLNQFIQTNQESLNTTLELFLSQIRKLLPNIVEVPEGRINSASTGTQNKLELWETFKALNDSWIAGNDYSQTTLFEDILFLDRGNRDVGNKILVDPFKVKQYFNKTNISGMTSSVFYILSDILITHHMPPIILPSYVNYYNVKSFDDVPSVDSINEFGNNLFGTFLSVDVRDSSPKMVCRYTEPSSKYPENDPTKNENFRFNTDAFRLERTTDNPTLDKLENKTDWYQSNRLVGFNVDIGTRNQNIFKNFSVTQDIGKATTESLQAQLNLINQTAGRNAGTQNVSLYTLYKNRSYEGEVECLGNAMIQPTMYFNLRYVPMFYGPYYITSVEHRIDTSGFNTKFKGTRQSIFSLPKIKTYIQSNVKELLQSITTEKRRLNSLTTETTTVNNTLTQTQQTFVTNKHEITSEPTDCSGGLTSPGSSTYEKLVGTSQQQNIQTSLNVSDFKQLLEGSDKVKLYTFVISYLESYNGTVFTNWNNNYSSVKLNYSWGGSLNTYFEKKYNCQTNTAGKSEPFAVFTQSKFFNFMGSYLAFINNDGTKFALTAESILKYYITEWSKNQIDDAAYNQFTTTPEYTSYISKINQAILLYNNS